MRKKIILRVLGWILIAQAFGFGIKILVGFMYLFDGLPRHFIAQLTYMFLDFFNLITYPPIGWLRLVLFGVGIWLVIRKYGVKSEDAKA